MTDVWDFPRVTGDDRQGHATPKPVALCERVLRSSCPAGETLLVPFGGSGPDVLAAENTGRRAGVVELLPGWCDVICRRFEEHSGIVPVLESTGEPQSFLGPAS